MLQIQVWQVSKTKIIILAFLEFGKHGKIWYSCIWQVWYYFDKSCKSGKSGLASLGSLASPANPASLASPAIPASLASLASLGVVYIKLFIFLHKMN
jgi:hypothetical protein